MQRRIHENSLANLNRFQPGQSGNPGGRPRGIPRLSNCYERLLRMSVEELQQFRPATAAEATARLGLTLRFRRPPEGGLEAEGRMPMRAARSAKERVGQRMPDKHR